MKIIAAAFLYSTLALAQPPDLTDMSRRLVWQKEPVAVFGLRFGELVTPDDIRPCGSDMTGAKITFCRTDATGNEVSGFPIPWFRQGRLAKVNGVAVKLMVTASQSDFNSIKQVLVERYGPPTTGLQQEVRTLAGGVYTSERLLWMGRSLAVTLDEHVVEIGNTAITFEYVPSAASTAGQRAKQIKDAAAKL